MTDEQREELRILIAELSDLAWNIGWGIGRDADDAESERRWIAVEQQLTALVGPLPVTLRP